jgi:pantothenate kinase type III
MLLAIDIGNTNVVIGCLDSDYKVVKLFRMVTDLKKTDDLISRAGYTLTNSSKFDVIIMYFIQKKNYNMMEINTTLFEFDQPLLGA